LGAFTLLYRILNGVFHSSIKFNETNVEEETIGSSNNKLSGIIKVLDLDKPPKLAELNGDDALYWLVLSSTLAKIRAVEMNKTSQAIDDPSDIDILDEIALKQWSAYVKGKLQKMANGSCSMIFI